MLGEMERRRVHCWGSLLKHLQYQMQIIHFKMKGHYSGESYRSAFQDNFEMVPFDKVTDKFFVELNGMREVDSFARQSLDARSERQVVTLNTLSEYFSGQ